jgi:S-disulfanyl-L-cysteine oxidoreductase SoxD
MNKGNLYIMASILLVLTVMMGFWYLTNAGKNPVPVALTPDNTEVIFAGKTIYLAQCAACHGKDLQGQPDWKRRNAEGRLPAPPHDQTGHTWHHTDQLLFDLTKKGLQAITGSDYATDMPAYKDLLSDQGIIAVLSYIKSTWPTQIRQRHDSMNKAPASN